MLYALATSTGYAGRWPLPQLACNVARASARVVGCETINTQGFSFSDTCSFPSPDPLRCKGCCSQFVKRVIFFGNLLENWLCRAFQSCGLPSLISQSNTPNCHIFPDPLNFSHIILLIGVKELKVHLNQNLNISIQ